MKACASKAFAALQSPAVNTESTDRGQQLAKRLKDAGAKMYGAFWCSHCHEQKEAFGAQAMKDFPYVECYPDGFHKVLVAQDHCHAESTAYSLVVHIRTSF